MDSFPDGSNDPSRGDGFWGAGAAQLKGKAKKFLRRMTFSAKPKTLALASIQQGPFLIT